MLYIGSADTDGVQLDGFGTVNLSSSTVNRVTGWTGGEVLHNMNNTIRGSGRLGEVDVPGALVLVNDGAIVADQSAELLLTDLGNVANAGVLRAEGEGVLRLRALTIATVALDALVDDATAGQAELIADGDGFTLRVDAAAVPADGEFLELWLIDEGVTEPRSLGRFTGAGEYDVPADIDPNAFPIVDISTEPDDGDESHSGASVLRGALEL